LYLRSQETLSVVNTLSIDIGGTKLAMAVFDVRDRNAAVMIRREIHPTEREGGREWMLSKIKSIAHAWKRNPGFGRCGIGFGGPVDFRQQRVALSTHVSGWEDFPLVQNLTEVLEVPVVMDNDANAGALGESQYGAGKSHRPLLYMTLSTGIGGGIILEDGSVHRGADSYAGEVGHLTIRPDGPECLCGARGCFERMCGGLWLERDYGIPPAELLQDPEFVARYVADAALGIKAAVMLLNPARVVLGGGIAKAGEALFVPLRKELRRQITAWSRARIDLVPAALGDDSVLWGALALAGEMLTDA
jgi:glucokinase